MTRETRTVLRFVYLKFSSVAEAEQYFQLLPQA
jgi:hypothetical protein